MRDKARQGRPPPRYSDAASKTLSFLPHFLRCATAALGAGFGGGAIFSSSDSEDESSSEDEEEGRGFAAGAFFWCFFPLPDVVASAEAFVCPGAQPFGLSTRRYGKRPLHSSLNFLVRAVSIKASMMSCSSPSASHGQPSNSALPRPATRHHKRWLLTVIVVLPSMGSLTDIQPTFSERSKAVERGFRSAAQATALRDNFAIEVHTIAPAARAARVHRISAFAQTHYAQYDAHLGL